VAAPKEEAFDHNGVYVTAPVPVRETWEAMEELTKAGLVRDIGVANFTAPMLIDLLSYATVAPAVNQIELHPYFSQPELVEYCVRRGVQVTAYCPLGSPGNFSTKGPLSINDPAIASIAGRLGKSPAQVILRWGIQRGTVVIPKSTNPERIKENISVFDFVLEDSDMATINGLNRSQRLVNRSHDWKTPYFD
jgi:diketogulonate reductase-like aldo/keto reductase